MNGAVPGASDNEAGRPVILDVRCQTCEWGLLIDLDARLVHDGVGGDPIDVSNAAADKVGKGHSIQLLCPCCRMYARRIEDAGFSLDVGTLRRVIEGADRWAEVTGHVPEKLLDSMRRGPLPQGGGAPGMRAGSDVRPMEAGRHRQRRPALKAARSEAKGLEDGAK